LIISAGIFSRIRRLWCKDGRKRKYKIKKSRHLKMEKSIFLRASRLRRDKSAYSRCATPA